MSPTVILLDSAIALEKLKHLLDLLFHDPSGKPGVLGLCIATVVNNLLLISNSL